MPSSTLFLPTFASPYELRTARCLLRQWRDEDTGAWVAMNQDPEVRRFFPTVATPDEAIAEMGRARTSLARRGWGAWALEIPGVMPFAGFVGLIVPMWEAPFNPAIEIGWRLPQAAWGKGFAPECAEAALQFAFEMLRVPEVVAITTPTNLPSRRVMEKIGMHHDAAGDFDHPKVPDDNPCKRHVLYRVANPRPHDPTAFST